MNFFEELKRRNVFRVGIAYAISAWVLLQIVDLVLENIAAPEWVMQVFMLALAIGFPLALLFAWAFEMTPEGVRLERDVDRSESMTRKTGQKLNRNIIIALAVAVVFLLVDRFQGSGSMSPEAVQTVASEKSNLTLAPTEKSIAVLPFVDMSPKGDQAYFADGISEEILNVLVKTHSLKVAGRTSSFQFRGRNEDLRKIGDQLGVEHILEGSIRKANNRVRITAQLVKAQDGFHLWSETYDRELTDIFAIQDEIASAITDALAIELDLEDRGKSLVTPTTSNMDAYNLFLKGRALIAQRSDFPQAIRLLNEATKLDPEFAAGWATGAQAYALSFYYIAESEEEALQTAERMANRALELDPDLATAHSALGDIYRDRQEWMKAKNSYLRALELNPNYVEANSQFAQMLWRARYYDEALKHASKASSLDPLSWINQSVTAAMLYATGDTAEAWERMEKAIALGALNASFALRHAFRMALNDGQLDRAIELVEDISEARIKEGNEEEIIAAYQAIIPLLHSREKTLAYLNEQQPDSKEAKVEVNWLMDIYWAAYYGDYALAQKILDRGTNYGQSLDVLDTSWFNYPLLNPLHNSEAYKRMITRSKLDQFWRENGFPKHCRPLGDDDFACN
jgi:TolB-like protein/Tfp pilus assembly protein PilF